LFPFTALEETTFRFKIGKLKKRNFSFGVGLKNDLLNHNELNKKNIYSFNPYLGVFRGNCLSKKVQHLDLSKK
jgi:hypothetical protein